MAANQKVYVEITGTAQRLVNEVTKAQKSLGFLELSARRLQNTIMGIGAYQVLSGITTAVNTIAEFDKVITQVGVITGATGDQFNKLEDSALTLGRTTQYTAKQVAELQLEFGRLGFSTREILASTEATVNLATATGESLSRSAEIAGSTLRAYNLDAKEMGRVTDTIAAALNNSALTLDSFADGIKYVAPVAAATNVTLEETAAMMSVLADAGIKGSQAGTSLRRIFTMLTDDGKPLQERLNELAKAGISVAQANDEVGLYAQTALIVLSKYKPRIDELTKAYNDAKGSTDEMARAMKNNLATSITKVGTAWDALILSFRNGKGIMMDMADTTANILNLMATDKLSFLDKLLALGSAGMGGYQLTAVIAQMKGLEAAAKMASDNVSNLIEDSALALVKDYGDDLYSIELALAGNVNKSEIYLRVLDLLKQSQIDQAKAIVENTQRIEENNRAKQEALRLAYEQSELERGARIAKLERQQQPIAKTPIENLQQFASVDNVQIENVLRYAEAIQEVLNKMKGLTAEQIKQLSMRDMWIQFGETVANQLDNVIAKNKSLGQSVAELAGRVIDSNREIIISNLKAGLSGIFARFPIGAPIIAGLALSGISGLLKRVGRTSDETVRVSPVSSGRVSMSGAQNSSTLSGTLRGQDIYLSGQNYQKYNRSTAFIG